MVNEIPTMKMRIIQLVLKLFVRNNRDFRAQIQEETEIAAAVAKLEIRQAILYDSHSPSMTSTRTSEWQYVRSGLNANYQSINRPNHF